MITKKEFVATKAGIWTFGSTLVGLVFGFALQMLLSRALGPNDYGKYSFAYSVFIVFTLIFTPGLILIVTKYVSISESEFKVLKAALKIEALLDVLLSVVFFLILNYICHFFDSSTLKPCLIVLGITMIPQGVRNIIKAFFNGKMDLSYCFNIELAYQICKIFFIYLFIYLRKGILGVMSGLLIAEILSIFVAIYLLFKFAKTRCTSCADRDTLGVNQHSIIKELAIKSLPYWVLGIIGLFATKMDIFCIKFFLSDYTKVAYYDTARSLIDSIGLFLSIATISLWPILSVAAKKNDQNMARQYIGRIIRYGFLFGLPICVWVATNSSVVMSLVFSYKFVSGAGVLAVLAIGRFWIILFSNIINIITMVYGNIWLFVIITISGVPILIFMNWLFIPSLGILGAAIAGMIASIIVIVFLLIYLYNFTLVFRNNMLTINKLTFFRGMAAALVSFGITQAVYLPNSILAFFMKSALFVLAYSYLLFYFKEINQEDKRIIGAIWAKIHGVTRSGN